MLAACAKTYTDLVPEDVLIGEISGVARSAVEETPDCASLFCDLLTVDLDFVAAHFGVVESKFKLAKFVAVGMPPMLVPVQVREGARTATTALSGYGGQG